jgi:hypothetical protein
MNQMKNSSVQSSWETAASENIVVHKSYHELSDRTVVEADALAQLHGNLEMLADLQGRLSFLMKEVRYLLKV